MSSMDPGEAHEGIEPQIQNYTSLLATNNV